MFYCKHCGRESKNKSVIDNCKHTRLKKNNGIDQEQPELINEIQIQKQTQNTILENIPHKIIKKVYHCSDIHIRLNSLHDIYKEVFSNFYTMLRTSEPGIIVCCGDILHNKNELSPECIVLVLEFLTNLANIMPTFIIAGNHDAVLNNKEKMDSLSGILNKHTIDNLFYLKLTGTYKYNNIIFGVSSLLDNDFIYADSIIKEDYETLIGLYHGSVGTPVNDIGYKISGEKSINEFKGYDIVMLGDIHKFQYLNENKTIAYSSSLISQNFGECDEYHGYLEWNIHNRESIYRIVPNDYRYIRIVFNQQTHITIPSKCNLQVSISNYNEKNDKEYLHNLLKFKKYIKETYPNARVNYLYMDTNKTQHISNKLDNLTENLLIYITKQYPNISQNDIEWVMKNIDFSPSDKSNNIHWSLLYMKWDYMYKYGPNNIIDFRNLSTKAINGLIAPNSSGKSTFIDIITFILFSTGNRDISNRLHKQPDIINKNQDKCCGTIYFSTNQNNIYMIEKTVVRKKNTNTIDILCHFYKLNEDINGNYKWDDRSFNKECLDGKQRKETELFISEIIGSYEDFVFHSLCLQFDNKSFRTMPPKERKEFMYRLFNLDFLTKQHPNAFDNFKKNKNIVNTLKKSLENFDITALQKQKQFLQNEIYELKEAECKNDKDRKYLNEKLNELYKKLFPIQKNITNNEHIENIKKLNELNDIIEKTHEFKYAPYQNEITIENNLFLKERDRKCELILEEIMDCNRQKKHLIPLDEFDKNRFIELSQKIFPVDIKLKLVELNMKLHNINVVEKPKYTREECNQLISIIENDIIKIDIIKKIIYVDNTVLEKYNNYLHDLATNNRINSSIVIFEQSIKRIETEFEYNPNCNICIKNPQTIQLINMQTELINLKKSLLQIDDSILFEYEQYLIQKNNYDIEERRIENALNSKNILHKQKLELQDELNHIDKYEEYKCKEQYRKEYEILAQHQKEYDEYLALKELEKFHIENNINIQNNNILDNKITKLNEQRQLLLTTSYSKYNELLKELDIYYDYNKNIENAKIEKNNIITNIEIYKNIINNAKIQEEINNITDNLKSLDNTNSFKISELQRELGEIDGKIVCYETTLKSLNDVIIELRRYEYLEGILNVKGFSLYLLENNLANISNGVSEILSPLIGISLKLNIENNDLIMYTYKIDSNKESRLDTFGGMEQFMIDFSFRVLSLRYTMLPRCDLFILDETFSCFDMENLGKINIIYDLLYSLYDHIIVITHLDKLKDTIHNKINLTNNGEYASIKI